MADKHLLLSLLLLAAFALFAWWHLRENKLLASRWRKNFGPQTAKELEHFAWSRTFQMLALLASCIAIIMIYDMQLRDTKKLLGAAEIQAKTPPPAIPAPASPPETVRPTAQPEPSYYPPAVSSAPAPSPTLTGKSTSAKMMEEVYNPEREGNDSQSAMDDIKKRYEDVLVIYMFLKKCGRADPADYRVITSALGQEMASVNAPGRLQYDIQTAAQGSYNEVYSKSPCEGKEIESLHGQYTHYIKTLSDRFPVQ